MSKSKIVIALGGNAIIRPGQQGTIEEQEANLKDALKRIVELVQLGHEIMIIHGNGPQVGNLLLQQEAARDGAPILPLDVCVAQTQGQIGYIIQNGLSRELEEADIDKPVLSIVTRVQVDENDIAFENPTKPVGSFFTESYAKERIALGEHWMEDSGRGWRRVVPSPKPLGIVELPIISASISQGSVVVAGGGGGIPVIRNNGRIAGVEAVIDKDLTGALVATEIKADMLIILTDVENVAINFGKRNQINLERLTLSEAQNYLDQGQFGTGSMGPKVQACMDFVKETGGRAVITSLNKLIDAVHGVAGTSIVS